MLRSLVAECMQEVSSFDPLPSTLDDFTILRGDELLARHGSGSHLGGACAVLEATPDIEPVR